MKLHNLTKTIKASKKRVGRGIGSGKGKTSGRGTKGQKARGKVPMGFNGSGLALYKKLPMGRGQGGRGGSNQKSRSSAIPINIAKLEVFAKGTTVSLQQLIDANLVDKGQAAKFGVKIVGKDKLSKSLNVDLPTTKGATEVIESAGGKVVRLVNG